MKRFIPLLVISFFIRLLATGQQNVHQQLNFVLNQPVTGNETYEARNYVELNNGFEYTPQNSSNQFTATINPYLVFLPEDGITNGGPNSNDNGVVGTTDGTFNVSATGAANYSIPIDVPPGIAGMQPNLALVYNSQGGNGLLGLGWSLSGLSSITRTGTTIYNDGNKQGIKFNSEDRFALDGNRLISVNGGYGENNTEYRTENETFSKIISYRTSYNGPESFIVYTKSGLIMNYGTTEDSRIEASGSSDVVLTWLLTEIVDRKGNYIKFNYYENHTDGIFYPQSIEYTGNHHTNQLPTCKILFYPETRPDNNVSYISGNKIGMNSRIRAIDILNYSNNDRIKEYLIHYVPNERYSKITSIQLIDKYGNGVNPVKFVWGEESQSFTPNNIPNVPKEYTIGNDIYIMGYETYGDFNGDGKTDVIVPYYVGNIQNYRTWKLYLSSGSSFSYTSEGDLTDSQFLYFIPGDFNGDGKQDLLRICNTSSGDVSPSIYLSDPTSASYFSVHNMGINPSNHCSFYVDDFDGDGKSEVLQFHPCANPDAEPSLTIYKINDSPFSIQTFDLHTHQFSSNFQLFCNDMNGDGRNEIVIFNDDNSDPAKDGISIYKFNEGIISLAYQNEAYNTRNRQYFMGDFNGDGIADILYWQSQNPRGWTLNLFDGTGFQECICPPLESNHGPGIDPGENKYFLSDFNGDGKCDILEAYDIYINSNYEKTSFNLYYYNGNSFKSEHSFVYAIRRSKILPSTLKSVDFNGDGESDMICKYLDAAFPLYQLNFFPNNKSLLLKDITDQYNNVTEINYNTLSSAGSTLYTKENTETYPFLDFQGPLNVVCSINHTEGSGRTFQTLYTYAGAKVHLEGKGFLGFKGIQSWDITNHIKNESSYNLLIYSDNVFMFSPVGSKQTSTFPHNVLLSQKTCEYIPVQFDNKRIYQFMSKNLIKKLGHKRYIHWNNNDSVHGFITIRYSSW